LALLQNSVFDSAKLKDFALGEGVAAGASAELFDTSGWIDASVPGDVHRALMAAGRIEDPFYDRNEEKCAWMEEREWWYRLSFEGPQEPPGPDERLLLIFHGLDTSRRSGSAARSLAGTGTSSGRRSSTWADACIQESPTR
jgi:hypothetical protein